MHNIYRMIIRIDGVYFQTNDTLLDALNWFQRRIAEINPWTPATLIELIELKELYTVDH